jgi:hypothetical protein
MVLSSDAGWRLNVYESAGEASGTFRYARRSNTVPVRPGQGQNPERARAEAARRARSKLRRYCASNLLNRFGTLTYAGDGVHDPLVLREHVAAFWRQLRTGLGGDPFPYAWVPEWHPGGHGLHVHFAVGGFVPRGQVDGAWGRGFIKIKLIGDLPVGSTERESARVAARYMAKYASKDFGERAAPGLHRYEIAQGFQPKAVQVGATSRDGALQQASELMGGQPDQLWDSGQNDDWQGPPAVWASWR